MPSFRVTLVVGRLRPGTAPQDVLPEAARSARELTTVEAYDVGVVGGEARVTVRFTAADDVEAQRVAGRVHTTVAALAQVTQPRLTRRWGPRWETVRGETARW